MRKKRVLLVVCLVFACNIRAQQVQMQQRFESAYKEIVNMLEDKEPLSIKRSVFLAEWAYLDGNLDYEQDFCEPLSQGAQYMRRLITANKWERYKTANRLQSALSSFNHYQEIIILYFLMYKL